MVPALGRLQGCLESTPTLTPSRLIPTACCRTNTSATPPSKASSRNSSPTRANSSQPRALPNNAMTSIGPKYYIYISDAKIDMLLPQVPHDLKKKVATEFKLKRLFGI